MRTLTHTHRARLDLLSIWEYVAKDNLNAADRLLDLIHEKSILLSEHSQLGQARPDIALDMRYLPVKSYLILYREQSSGIEIVRILHGSRDLEKLIKIDDE